MHVLVTGVAGFIGFHVAARLLARGDTVVGLDNINAYYDVRLKEARLAQLRDHDRFTFVTCDLADQRFSRLLVYPRGRNKDPARVRADVGNFPLSDKPTDRPGVQAEQGGNL